MSDQSADFLSVPGEVLWRLFVLADGLANHPEIACNEDIQYQAIDLACGLSELVKEFELIMKKEGRTLSYEDSIFMNPQYEWYVEDDA